MKPALRDNLSKGKTKEVIDELATLVASDVDLHNRVTQLSARFAQYERQKLGNLEDPSILGIELNRINEAVLAIITELEKTSPITKPATSFRTIWTGLNDVKSWIVVFAGLAGFLIIYLEYSGHKTIDGMLKNVTVNVRDKDGTLVESLLTQGYVIMTTSGGGAPKELIDDKGAASFKNIKVGDNVRLSIEFSEPYQPIYPDSVYTVPEDGRIHLTVALQHLGKVFGRVIYRDKELPGVIVAVGSLRDTTDDLGRYEIFIPENEQRPDQEVFFKKDGFKSMTKRAYPQTNQPLNVILER